jgi:hypothetical protein
MSNLCDGWRNRFGFSTSHFSDGWLDGLGGLWHNRLEINLMRTPEEITLLINTLQKAIETKSPVAFFYEKKIREVCAYLLGDTAKGLVIHAYQYGGESSKGRITNPDQGSWKYFYFDKIEKPVILSDKVWWPIRVLTKGEILEESYTPPKFITKVVALAKIGDA